MSVVAAVVRRCGHATVQDLGRPGLAHLGITANGAGDQHAARTANVLVGNADGAALVEITGSSLELSIVRPLLVAVTGAADRVLVDGRPDQVRRTLVVPAGATLVVPAPARGLRSYLAINGVLDAERVYGSVAPDAFYGVDPTLEPGAELRIDSVYEGPGGSDPYTNLFDLAAAPVSFSEQLTVEVTSGPDRERLTDGSDWLHAAYTVDPRSDAVGLRLSGPPIGLRDGPEILSRGVPVGAVEVTPTGGVLVLLRARLLTAGYPVIAVATTASLDRLSQAAPGATIRFVSTDVDQAREALRARESVLDQLAARVARALSASGLGAIVDPGHRSRAH